MLTGIVPPLAVSLFHWEDFSLAIGNGMLLPAWETLLESRSEIESKRDHLNDDQRLRLARADAIIRTKLIPLLRSFGRYDYYCHLRENQERMNWWYFLD